MFKLKFNAGYCFFILIFCIGLFFRLKLYFLNLSFHCDEANLALNLISRSYPELFLPLERLQVAPPFFLVLSKIFYQFAFFNFTPRVSDLMLRLIPLVSGIAAIPAFGFLLQRLFKNKFITAAGMLILALAPSAVLYSCIFKQYSTELLVSILTLILFSKIDLKVRNFKPFLLLGLMPFLSLSSFFVLAGGFCYLWVKERCSRNLAYGTGVFLAVLVFYTFVFLIPVHSRYYHDMSDYWNASFSMASGIFSYVKILLFYLFRTYAGISLAVILFFVSVLLMLRNLKVFCFTAIPVLLAYIGVITKHYPLDERLMVFIIPLVIIILLYPFTLIPHRIYKSYSGILYLILAVFITVGSLKFPSPIEYIVTKPEAARNVWEYLNKNYDGKTPVILGYSLNTNVYYKMFYNKFNYCNFILINNTKETLKNLPAGDYYIVLTGCEFYQNLLGSDFDTFLKEASEFEILESTEFIPPHINGFTEINSGRLLKIRKNRTEPYFS